MGTTPTENPEGAWGRRSFRSAVNAASGLRLSLSYRDAGLIRARALRELVATVGPIAEDLSREAAAQLGVATDTEVDISFDLSLPTELVTPIADVLRSIDLAWRLAGLVSDYDEGQVPPYSRFSLDDPAPPDRYGLSFVDAHAGSFKGTVKSTRTSLKRAYAFAEILAVLFGVAAGLGDVKAVLGGEASRAGGTPCQVTLAGKLKQPLPDVIDQEFGELPDGCVVTIDVETSEGARIKMKYVKSARAATGESDVGSPTPDPDLT